MPQSHTNSQRSDGIWPKTPAAPAIQVAILLAVSIAAIFCIDLALGASWSRLASKGDAPVSTPADCPQSAETFDRQRAACLRRRWLTMRDMRPWPDASQNPVLEDCLRSPQGEILVPFKTNSCVRQTAAARPSNQAASTQGLAK